MKNIKFIKSKLVEYKMKRLLLGLLMLCILPLCLSLVSAHNYVDGYYDLNDGCNGFGVPFNDSYLVEGGVNVSIGTEYGSGPSGSKWNFLAFSSNETMDVNDVYFCNTTRYDIIVRRNDTIDLVEGWNMISLNFLENATYTGDRNISVASGWNLLGNSALRRIYVDEIDFTNSTQTYTTPFEDGYISNISVQRDGEEITLTTGTGTETDYIKPNEGYWLYSLSDGNITIPDIGGGKTSLSLNWDDLKFRNESSGEVLNITEAISNSWIDDIQYWNITQEDFATENNSLNSWQGYFINSTQENITLIHDTSTNPTSDNLAHCYTYQQAVENDYIGEFEASSYGADFCSTTDPAGGDKYLSELTPNLAFWVYSNNHGWLYFPTEYHVPTGTEFSAFDLKFWNGSMEVSQQNAGYTYSWIYPYFFYFNNVGGNFPVVPMSPMEGDYEMYSFTGYNVFTYFDNITLLTDNRIQPQISLQCPLEKKILRLKRKFMSKCDDSEPNKSKRMSVLCKKLKRRIRRLEHKCDLWESKHNF